MTGCEPFVMAWMVCLTLVYLFSLTGAEFTKDFMGASCGERLQPRVSGRLETTQSLTYDNGMDCEVTLSVVEGRRILLFMKRFELEPEYSSACLDRLVLYDGINSNSPRLTNSALCGTIEDAFNITTSSNHVTFQFVSDGSAVYRGFAFEYTEFTVAPCGDLQFECENGICINIDNACDDVNQCGDNSDEAYCTVEEILASRRASVDLGLIIGCTVAAIIVLIILIIVIYKVYQYYKWRRFLKMNHDLSVDDLYQYPVTDRYSRHDIGKKGRRPPEVKSYYNSQNMATPYSDNGKYLDEL